MNSEELTGYEDLLTWARSIPPARAWKQTFFDVSGRGHYENPLSDLLRFFLDPKAAHGLGNVPLVALSRELEIDYDAASSQVLVTREELTEENKRLDIAVIFPVNAILIEMKVFHAQVNPFSSYVQSISKRYGIPQDSMVKVVISPRGEVESAEALTGGWRGMGFKRLAMALRSSLADLDISRWRVLYEEFITHLVNLSGESSMNDQAMRFVAKNLAGIRKLEALKLQYLTALSDEIHSIFTEITGDDDAEAACVDWPENWGKVIIITPRSWGLAAQAGFAPTASPDNNKCGAVIWASRELQPAIVSDISAAMSQIGARPGSSGKRILWDNYECSSLDEGKVLFRKMVKIYHQHCLKAIDAPVV